jgi:hypothetical protein
MNRRPFGLAATLAGVVFAAACSDAPSTAPQAGDPLFANTTSPNACVFSGNPSLSNASNAYFTVSSDKNAASALINSIQAGFEASGFASAAAKEKGFDLLSLAGKVSRAGTGSSPADGAVLVRQTIQCMFDVEDNNDNASEAFFGWPTVDQFDFATALTPSAGGALYVRGGTADSATYPVIAHGSTGNISAIAPAGTATWPNTLSNRALIYGEPVTGGYDWKLIPRATTFTPSAVVALCQAVQPGGFDDDEMVHQESVGVLGFVGAQAATMCGMTASVALREGPFGSFALVGRLAQFADRLLAPQPLYASSVLRSSTIGGSASGAKGDPFTSLNVPEVNLTFSSPGVQPPANVKVNTRFSLEVNVSTPDGEPAGGITVSLAAQTNNGTSTGIFQVLPSAPATFVCDPNQSYIKPGAPSATTLVTVGIGGASQPTNAKWNNNLCFSKTGSVYVFGASVADGHPAAGIGSAKSNKVNVKP